MTMDNGGGRTEIGREWDVLELDGGPVVPGVDYEGEWLRARAASVKLNASLARWRVARERARAQAGWAPDGTGRVTVSMDTATASAMARLLDLVAGPGNAA